MANTKSTGSKKNAARRGPARKRSAPIVVSTAGPRTGVGAFVHKLVVKGKSNEEILAQVANKFPDARTSASSVSWYRSRARAAGEI